MRDHARPSKRKKEFGDFQTPAALASAVCKLLVRSRVCPSAVLEPTCGRGSFLLAAIDRFPSASVALGVDVNAEHLRDAAQLLKTHERGSIVRLKQETFFDLDWERILTELPEPLLVIGNPPWVTNSDLGALGSSNLPQKSNFQGRRGLDAVTGKSNFDISEWMLLRMLEWIRSRRATLAMLVKTAVARKIILHAWQTGVTASTRIHLIDAEAHFGATVDACLLVVDSTTSAEGCTCPVYRGLQNDLPVQTIGWRDGRLVADVSLFDRWAHLGGESEIRWRSGVKHDCSKVMELRRVGDRYYNGLKEPVDIESQFLFPMLKSSHLASADVAAPNRRMLIPQRTMNEPTDRIRHAAPRTWAYLEEHAELLDRRASSIYRNRPRFSVFGVGEYTFAPWKIAISGLYKSLDFRVVGQHDDKPIVLDDTAYCLPCASESQARQIAALLASKIAREFLVALVFWDSKRPITVDVLRRLSLVALARETGLPFDDPRSSVPEKNASARHPVDATHQGQLFP